MLRLLAPPDFGIVGLVMAALSILEVLSDLSFQAGLIRMSKPRRVHYDTAWTLGILRGAVMGFWWWRCRRCSPNSSTIRAS